MAEEIKKEEIQEPAVEVAVEATPEEVAPVAEEPVVEATAVEKKPRELFFERVRTNMPEGKYDEDEEEYFRNAASMLDKAEEGSKKYKNFSDKFQKVYESDPERAALILGLLEDVDKEPISTFVDIYGEDAVSMREGMEGWDDYVSSREAHKKRLGESAELIKALQTNAAESEKAFNEFAEEQNLSEEERESLLGLITGDVNNTNMGKWEKKMLERYLRSLRYDNDLAAAREQGRVDGRNERITAERKHREGSGLPNGAAGGSAEQAAPAREMSSTEKFLAGITRR